jgi:hypothetical protein
LSIACFDKAHLLLLAKLEQSIHPRGGPGERERAREREREREGERERGRERGFQTNEL